MARQSIITAALLVLVSNFVYAETNEDQQDAQTRYATIHTVLWVGGDVDRHLDVEDKQYWSRPTEDRTQIFATLVDSEESTWDALDLSAIDLLRLQPPIEFELTPSDWFARNDTFATDLAAPLLVSQGHLEIGMLPQPERGTMPVDFSEQNEQITWHQPTQEAASLGNWPSTFDDAIARMDSNEQQSLAAAPPIMAAIVPASSSAENAGLWFFLSIMIAPFAWLGWQEYQELKSRSRNVDLLDSLEGSLDRGQLEEELRQIDIEVTQQGEQEVDEVGEVEDAGEEVREEVGPVGESELTEISASAEDDCEYELGVLEDANALLATAGGASRESSAEPRRESAPAAESEAEFSQDDSGESFDLTMLRGVGGVTRNYLVSHGIRNVGDLEDAGAERIREILNEAGAKFQTACPEKWVQQARELLATTR